MLNYLCAVDGLGGEPADGVPAYAQQDVLRLDVRVDDAAHVVEVGQPLKHLVIINHKTFKQIKLGFFC